MEASKTGMETSSSFAPFVVSQAQSSSKTCFTSGSKPWVFKNSLWIATFNEAISSFE